MNVLKAVGIAALVGSLLAEGCVKRSQSEIQLEQKAQEALPSVAARLEERLGIQFEELPDVIVSPGSCGSSSISACHDFNFWIDYFNLPIVGDKIIINKPEVYSEDPKKIPLTLSHELGHHYIKGRAKKLGLRYAYATDDQKYFDEFTHLLDEKKANPQSAVIRHDLRDFIDASYLPFSRVLIDRVFYEGIADYFKGQKSLPPKKHPETIRSIFNREHLTRVIHSYGFEFMEPLMDQFGVQPVLDYMLTHEPRVSGRIREDLSR